jgi:hypothetical protein
MKLEIIKLKKSCQAWCLPLGLAIPALRAWAWGRFLLRNGHIDGRDPVKSRPVVDALILSSSSSYEIITLRK